MQMIHNNFLLIIFSGVETIIYLSVYVHGISEYSFLVNYYVTEAFC